jgi:AcrR family transcriptional regulator
MKERSVMIERRTTKQLLAESIIDLVENQTLDSISIQNIVSNCGMARRTFYNNFQDKYDLLMWIYKYDALKYLQQIEKGVSWYSAILNKLQIIKSRRNFYREIYTNDVSLRMVIDLTKRIHYEWINKYLDVDKNLHSLIDFYCQGCVMGTADWICSGYRINPRNLMDFYVTCLPDKLKTVLLDKDLNSTQVLQMENQA